MTALGGSYVAYRWLSAFTGIIAWFTVVAVAGVAIVNSCIFANVEGIELSTNNTGLGALLVVGCVIGMIVVILSLVLTFNEELESDLRPLFIPMALTAVACLLWFMCGVNAWLWQSRDVPQSDMVRVSADGSVSTFEGVSVPRGYLVPLSTLIPLVRTYQEESNVTRSGEHLQETIAVQIALNPTALEAYTRELLPQKNNDVTDVNNALSLRVNELVSHAIAQKRLAGGISIRERIPVDVPWIESAVVTKLVDAHTTKAN